MAKLTFLCFYIILCVQCFICYNLKKNLTLCTFYYFFEFLSFLVFHTLLLGFCCFFQTPFLIYLFIYFLSCPNLSRFFRTPLLHYWLTCAIIVCFSTDSCLQRVMMELKDLHTNDKLVSGDDISHDLHSWRDASRLLLLSIFPYPVFLPLFYQKCCAPMTLLITV